MDWFLRTVFSSAWPSMSPEQNKNHSPSNTKPLITPESITDVRSLFVQKLPPELVTQILELAQYWVSQTVTHENRRTAEFRDCNTRYLCTPPLAGGDFRHPLRQVVITTVSKDQGWSDHASQYQGTYEASWTWFELTLENPETGEEKYRTEIVRNIHAGTDFTKHVTYMSDPRLYELAEHGDTLSVWVRAKYPGWKNHVKFVNMETFVAY